MGAAGVDNECTHEDQFPVTFPVKLQPSNVAFCMLVKTFPVQGALLHCVSNEL